jgi:zinc protease
MITTLFRSAIAATAALLVASCGDGGPAAKEASLAPVETFTLENGLRVVFNIDRSDPVVAVVLAAHAGSARETPGRTGFAHMFEHLFFLDSENLGTGGLDKLSARVGGSGANGFTNNDQTVYLQTVPNDALEKMIWAEADKLGYFINTVTPAVLQKEKQVVKNEKRQSYDNQPYGHLYPALSAAMFPADHPYSWPVIGSLADLDAATLEDVKSFHSRWYVPNNATLVLSGDFDPAQAKAWVEKYFNDIPKGEAVERPKPRPAGLAETVRISHEDNFATLPQLTLAWPGPPAYDKDFWPTVMMMDLLTDGQEAPLNKAVVEDGKLAGEVGGLIDDGQLAGITGFVVTAFDGVDLDKVQTAMDAGFADFKANGVKPEALQRVKALTESQFLAGLGTVNGKAAALARYDGMLGRADFMDEDLARLRAVTAEDVMRVFATYIDGKAHVAASFVPKGQAALALDGSKPASVVEEPIVQGAEAPIDASADRPVEIAKTPSSFDRTVEPPFGAPPVVKAPAPWTAAMTNGLAVSGIEDRELPLVAFEFSIDGGRLREDPARPGLANVTAEMLTRGTETKTRAEFENALKALGAQVRAVAGDDRIFVSGNTLARNFPSTIALVEEMLLHPRWDAAELDLVKAAVTAEIQGERAEPNIIAERVLARLTWGPDYILGKGPLGTEATVASFQPADLSAFHSAGLHPSNARLRIAGAVSKAEAEAALASLVKAWPAGTATPVNAATPAAPGPTKVSFYDMPGAKQSVIIFASPGPARANADFYPAAATNFILGGGGFASRLTQQLREGKGYTYGVRSSFQGGATNGEFRVFSPVRSNVTLEAATLMRDIVRDYGATFTAADLDLTRASMAKSRARSFESLNAKLNMLATIGDLGLPADYVARENAVLDGLTLAQVQDIARRLITTDTMHIVVVGDAVTQAQRLAALGYGAPVMVKLD